MSKDSRRELKDARRELESAGRKAEKAGGRETAAYLAANEKVARLQDKKR